MTSGDLRAAVADLKEREASQREREKRYAACGRWNLRREVQEQRHRSELRRAEFERRLVAMEAGS